jgi:hypothetical protein
VAIEPGLAAADDESRRDMNLCVGPAAGVTGSKAAALYDHRGDRPAAVEQPLEAMSERVGKTILAVVADRLSQRDMQVRTQVVLEVLADAFEVVQGRDPCPFEIVRVPDA